MESKREAGTLGLPATSEEEFSENAVLLDLRENHIGFVVPPKSLVRGEFLLTTGAIIVGNFCGRLVCSRGSVIIRAGATFEGELEAEQVWIDGEIRTVSIHTAQIVALASRSTPAAASAAMGGLNTAFRERIAAGSLSRIVGRECVAISTTASGKADIASRRFAAHGNKFAARYLPLQQGLAAA